MTKRRSAWDERFVRGLVWNLYSLTISDWIDLFRPNFPTCFLVKHDTWMNEWRNGWDRDGDGDEDSLHNPNVYLVKSACLPCYESVILGKGENWVKAVSPSRRRVVSECFSLSPDVSELYNTQRALQNIFWFSHYPTINVTVMRIWPVDLCKRVTFIHPQPLSHSATPPPVEAASR